VVAVGPLPCLWRAPTDNDEYGGYAETWRRAGLDTDSTSRLVERLRAWQPLPQLAVVQVDWRLRGRGGQLLGHASFTYAVHGDGQVEVRCSFCLKPSVEAPGSGGESGAVGSGGGGTGGGDGDDGGSAGGGSNDGGGGGGLSGAESAPCRSSTLPTLPRLGVVLEVCQQLTLALALALARTLSPSLSLARARALARALARGLALTLTRCRLRTATPHGWAVGRTSTTPTVAPLRPSAGGADAWVRCPRRTPPSPSAPASPQS
jgi:hypothetical protein